MKKIAPLESIKLECGICMQSPHREVECGNLMCAVYRYRYGWDHLPEDGAFAPSMAISCFCVACIGGAGYIDWVEKCNGKLNNGDSCPLHSNRMRKIRDIKRALRIEKMGLG